MHDTKDNIRLIGFALFSTFMWVAFFGTPWMALMGARQNSDGYVLVYKDGRTKTPTHWGSTGNRFKDLMTYGVLLGIAVTGYRLGYRRQLEELAKRAEQQKRGEARRARRNRR